MRSNVPAVSQQTINAWAEDHNGDFDPYVKLAETPNGPQRCRFVDFYVLDPSSGVKAAENAGYAADVAAFRAYTLMREPLVAAAIAQKMNERLERTMITQDRVLHELALLGFSSLTDYDIDPMTGMVTPREGAPEYVMRAVSSVKFTVVIDENGNVIRRTEFKLWDKVSVLKMLGQHLAMFTDKIQLKGQIHVNQVWQIGDKKIEF